MTFYRFNFVNTSFHLVDNGQIENKQKIMKVQPYITYNLDLFIKYYYPSSDFVVDERILNLKE
jgi:hypothetical protein